MVFGLFALTFVAVADGCNNPSACSGVCASCKGQCETLKTGFPCGSCWSVDPSYGTSCLSDRPEQPDDCRSCWHPTPGPQPPSPPTPPTPPPSGKFTCKGIPYVSGQCVDDPKGIYGSEGACSLSCGGAAPPAPPPAPRPNPFSKECKAMLETDCGKFTPHGEKTSGTNCNGCISYHAKDIVPLCGGWQPQEGGQVDFQNWCLDKYVPPVPTPVPPPPAPSPKPSPSPVPSPAPMPASGCPGGSLDACIELCPVAPESVYTSCVKNCGEKCIPSPTPSPPAPSPTPYIPGGCNDPTGACTDPNLCATCEGTCETLKTGPCAPCWAVDPTRGHACLSDSEGDHGDCRTCWHPTLQLV